MLTDDTRSKIKNITAGVILEGQQDTCTTARNLLCRSYPTSTTVRENFESQSIIKKEQAQALEKFCINQGLWIEELPSDPSFLKRGGEARVFLHEDGHHVLKLNDAIYYATWLEFLNSILLHNLIFPNTEYELLGFSKEGEILLAILKQSYIVSDAMVELNDIKTFLEFNAFSNTKNHDYEHKQLGLILEDMHDENVLVNSETLFFIDTVFYTVKPTH
ncbi:MAG: hypothetical protein H7Y42_07815 [Chitinophagaceae bacterium]|nr:hypothetical protein [Chitinophagaceae bacterium]